MCSTTVVTSLGSRTYGLSDDVRQHGGTIGIGVDTIFEEMLIRHEGRVEIDDRQPVLLGNIIDIRDDSRHQRAVVDAPVLTTSWNRCAEVNQWMTIKSLEGINESAEVILELLLIHPVEWFGVVGT